MDQDRGVVDEHVQATLGREDVRDHLARDGRIGEVRDDGSVERPGVLVQTIQAHDPMAGCGEHLAHGAAHPARATGHERDPRLRHRSLLDGTTRPHPGGRAGPSVGWEGQQAGVSGYTVRMLSLVTTSCLVNRFFSTVSPFSRSTTAGTRMVPYRSGK